MRGWSIACVTFVLFAGCMSASQETPSSDDGSTPSASGTSADTDATAPARASAPEAASAADGATARVVPIHLEGSIPTFVEACISAVVVGECIGAPPDAKFDNRYLVEETGNVTAFLVTLTWTASSPATEQLSFSFHSFNEDFSTVEEHGRAFGPSPLTIEITSPVELEPGLTHRIGVGVPFYGARALVAGVNVAATTDQDFVLDGAMTLAQVAPAAP
ncbi:MAG TPA: hypothetical protein VM370_03715 [Candidatus Thermoplasmatota archaeon]|nr:hypothetical protein [Candidatus Thermoplasmatota archaeon]